MKKIVKLFFLLLFTSISIVAFSQQIPFQGKLLENGQPVTGQKTFDFSIPVPPINWSESHVDVPIVNGLYSIVLGEINPLPDTLFQVQSTHELLISVNGTPLDTVDIYAPIEADPTVPANLKDGVSWDEIGNIPSGITDDIDSTNEIQSLELNGSLLSITKGNSVEITATDSLTILNSFQVGIYDTVNILDIEQPTGGNYDLIDTVWQSFTANHSGTLTDIWVEFANSLLTYIKLRTFVGEDVSGQPSYENTFPADSFSTAIQYQHFPIETNPPVSIQSGQKYTFQVIGISNPLMISSIDGNNYSGGRSSLGVDIDLKFQIYLNNFQYPGFIVPEQGHVMSIVNGVEFYMVPKGAIIMWSGSINNLPDGWALCDGTNGTPDLQDRFIVGAGNEYTISETGGEKEHVLSNDEMPAHTHTIELRNTWGNGYQYEFASKSAPEGSINTQTGSSGNNLPHENRPPYYALAFIMKI